MKRRDFLFYNTALFSAFPSLLLANNNRKWEKELAIPKLNEGVIENGKRVFNLEIKNSKVEFLQGLLTDTIGVNSNYLGETLKAKKGDVIKANIRNKIGEDATVHWHGFELPAIMDGGPHQVIKNNSTWEAQFKISNKASTLWYHSHSMHKTGEQVYKGLAGLFIIDDNDSEKLNLPNEYGIDDIPIVLQDRNFNQDGSFRYLTSMPERVMGVYGDFILVNGIISPVFKAKTNLIRFRILNGSNARFYNLGFSDNRSFIVIATDGGLLERPVSLKEVRLAPGERVEIVVDVSDRKDIMLQNYGGAYKYSMGMMSMMMQNMGADKKFNIMKIDTSNVKNKDKNIPKYLTTYPKIDIDNHIAKREFVLGMRMMMGMMFSNLHDIFLINGKSMDMNRIDVVSKKNSFEIWKIKNQMGMPHPFHIHNTQFKILSINGSNPPLYLSGLKDTVVVEPGGVVEVLVYFKNFSDEKHPYMFHCHILEHEDGGMMGQFLVV